MTPEQISVEVEASLLRALQRAWHELNASHFRRALAPPVFALIDGRARLGQWSIADRTLALSRPLVLEQPWGVVVEVLKHEMAHQFVAEVMQISDEAAHGPAFRELCGRLAIDAAASGLASAPGSSFVPGSDGARVLARVTKLLALADSPNQHEAESAMAAAQRMMLKYNLSTPARPSTATANAARGYGFRHLGTPSARTSEAERTLAMLLADHFFVEAIFVPVWRAREGMRGIVLEICGTPENLEMAGYAHDFLNRSSETLWREYRRTRRLDGNRERRSFIAGVMAGFQERLAATRVETRREGLVWVSDPELHRYYRQRHPHIRHARHGSSGDSGAHSDGKAAGNKLVLNRPMTGRTGASRRLLLGPG